ncbi:hypothetical protein H1235_12640 [Pseudoxanthomonas sp. NC8]|nr:hypothetical protein H1235_12640 [Pseudoxanthomonas sp. NC8]
MSQVEVVGGQLFLVHRIGAAVADAGEALARRAADEQVQLAVLDAEGAGEALLQGRQVLLVGDELLDVGRVEARLGQPRVAFFPVADVGGACVVVELVDEHRGEPGLFQAKRQAAAAGEQVHYLEGLAIQSRPPGQNITLV